MDGYSLRNISKENGWLCIQTGSALVPVQRKGEALDLVVVLCHNGVTK